MAVNVERFLPLRRARERRRETGRYLKLDSSRYLLGVAVLLGLMSMIALVQTGVVATKGYAIVALEHERTELLRQNSQLHLDLALAQSLDRIRERAHELGLRPVTVDQVIYLTIEEITPEGGAEPPAETQEQPDGEEAAPAGEPELPEGEAAQ